MNRRPVVYKCRHGWPELGYGVCGSHIGMLGYDAHCTKDDGLCDCHAVKPRKKRKAVKR